jgi:fructose-bisphosphate aldolase, class II
VEHGGQTPAYQRPGIAASSDIGRQGVLRVDGAIGDKDAFHPRARGRAGEGAMAERVRQACEQLGSVGRSLATSAPATLIYLD